MRNFFTRLSEGFRRFMEGRYGSDQLNRFLMGLALVMLVLNMFFGGRTRFFSLAVWLLLILTYLRMLSRNVSRRYNENTRYLQLREKVRAFFGRLFSGKGGARQGGRCYDQYSSAQSGDPAQSGAGKRSAPRSDREHRIFRCPACDQRVRVPRGRGRIAITCPKCGKEFVKRT